MAPTPTENDLLSAALKNKTILPSWRSIFTRITSTTPPSASALTCINNFLSSPSAQQTLSSCADPFPPPSPESKKLFDDLTAPINFTAADQPTGDASALPPIAELKTEAADLSKALDIDEVSALRIVVLEHQGRAGKSLLDSVGGGAEFNAGESILRTSMLQTEKDKEEKTFVNRLEVYFSERRYVVKVATALYRAAISKEGRENPWKDTGVTFIDDCVGGRGGMLDKIVGSIEGRWRGAGRKGEKQPKWVREWEGKELGPLVEHAWMKQNLTEIIHLMQLLFLQLYSPVEDVSALIVMKWFQFMKATAFLTDQDYAYADFPDLQKLCVYAQGLGSIVSLAILQLPKADAAIQAEVLKPQAIESSSQETQNSSATVSDDVFYITHPTAIQVVTDCLQEHPGVVAASLANLAWVGLIHLMHYLTQATVDWSDEEGTAPPEGQSGGDMYRKVLPALFPTTVEAGFRRMAAYNAQNMLNLIQILLEPSDASAATSAVSKFSLSYEEDGARMRNVLAQLIRRTNEYVDFNGDTIMATYWTTGVQSNDFKDFEAFLGQESNEDTAMLTDGSLIQPENWFGSPARKFWADPESLKMVERAKNRFPYEPLPFLKIIRGLASENAATLDYLTNMTSFTQTLPPNFTDYDIIDEDAATMSICLTSPLPLFPDRDSGAYEDEAETANGYFTRYGGLVIPPGTTGVVISGSGSRTVVCWDFQYNALPLLGRIIETVVNDSNSAAKIGSLATEDVLNEIVGLFTILVTSSAESKAALTRIPGRYDVPQVLGEASDMLGRNRDIISLICDHLDAELNKGNVSTYSSFYVTGLQFLDSLIHILPGRVWPYLARSSLLERNGRGGALSRILSTVEVVRGTYAFTTTCLQIFEHLVDEAVRSCALHKGRKYTNGHVPAIRVPSTGTGGTGVTDIVQRDILLSFTRTAVDIFESYRKMRYADLSENWEIGTRLARIFTTILGFAYGVDDTPDMENKITSVLIPSAQHLVGVFLPDNASMLPLQPISETILDGVNTPESSLYLHSLRAWVSQVVQVIKFADMLVRTRVYLGLPPSQLERHLYTDSPMLAKLYAANEEYKRYVLELLESLVRASASNPEEPPSLLGYLGATIANHFVTLLVTVDKPYQEILIETRVWNFVTAVVSHKQQGMSILLLRGETLRQGTGAPAAKKKSILSACLDALEDIANIPVEKTLAMLETVSTAQNFWSLALEDLGKHSSFLPTITKHVETFDIELSSSDSKEAITEKAHKICVAAYIARILALYLHSRRPSERDENFFKQLVPKLNFYFNQACKISGYRASLHGHLQKNFEEKWPGVKLSQIKKTKLRRKEFGTDAVYDVELAGKILGFDPNWESREDGYKNEVEQANLNLSLVQTQVNLLQGWQLLAVELCAFAKSSTPLAQSLLTVVESCLNENIQTGLPAPIFSQIIIDRSEFAFIIVERLHSAVPTLDLTSVFTVAWKGINSSVSDFRAALSSADMLYYRSLLRIIYLCLRSLQNRDKKENTTKFNFMVLDMLDLLVCKGFKDIAQAAHSHPDRCNPDDLSLLIAILQSSLRLQGIDEIHAGLQLHLAEQHTVRAATTLFSWSDNLPGGDTDPIYPELALKFLLALSTVDLIAEHLAIENTLASILSSTLSQRLATGGITSFNAPRLHSLWARGLLPLALNLLAIIGARVGREVVGFLLTFKAQIETAAEGWRKPSVVTLAAVEEAVGIALVLVVLERLGGKGELGVDTGVMEEGVGYLLGHRNYLRSLCVEGEEETGKIEEGLGQVMGLLGGEEEE